MQYAKDGSLRNNLKNTIYSWEVILYTLHDITISGLKSIHDSNIVHCDLHAGNILVNLDVC